MKRHDQPLPPAAGDPVAVEVIGPAGEVEFHFPVEIHMEAAAEPIDLQRIADHVYERLARRLSNEA